MDPLELLASLESLREKIPGFLRQDFEDLIAGIRNTYEMSVKFVMPPEAVHDGRRNLAAHHSTLDGLCTQLESSLEAFQLVYIGQGSDAYHTRAEASLQDLQVMRDHLAQAAVLHNTMATNFDTATEAKLALVALLVGLGITLGVLIASAGTTAPVTVPAAAVEVAGGAVSIGLMTEAEAAAAAAIMGLIWAGMPEALMAGLEGFAATEVLGHIALHPPAITLPHTSTNTLHTLTDLGHMAWPAITLPHTSTNTASPTNSILPSTIKKTDDGQTIRVRKLSPGEVKKLKTPWGRSFHDEKQKVFDATDDIYVDKEGNYWIGPHGSDYVTSFP